MLEVDITVPIEGYTVRPEISTVPNDVRLCNFIGGDNDKDLEKIIGLHINGTTVHVDALELMRAINHIMEINGNNILSTGRTSLIESCDF